MKDCKKGKDETALGLQTDSKPQQPRLLLLLTSLTQQRLRPGKPAYDTFFGNPFDFLEKKIL